MSLRIRPYESADLAAVFSLFERFGSGHPELRNAAAFNWQRAEKFVAVSGTEVVGYATTLPQPAICPDRSLTIGWGATLVVDTTNPARQLFAGTLLLDQITKKSSYPFAAVGVVPEIIPTHEKRGYRTDRDSMRMYAYFRRPQRALEYLNKPAYLAIGLHTANIAMALLRPTISDEVQEIDQLPDNLDVLAGSLLSSGARLATTRSSDYLSYKLSQPGKSYRLFATGTPNKATGLMIVREARHPLKPFAILRICELLGSKPSRVALVQAAMNLCTAGNLDGVVALGLTAEHDIYRRGGLWLAQPFPVVLDPTLPSPVRVSFMDSDLEHLW